MSLIERPALAFDDVRLVCQYSEVISRAQVDLSVKLKNTDIVMRTPYFASPMSTVSSSAMALALWKTAGAMAILHRYCSIEDEVKMVREAVKYGAEVGAAVGVSGDFVERATAVVGAGAKVLCVDVAHGHHSLMEQALKKFRPMFPKIHLMAGNVATNEGFEHLGKWGADSVRLGIGSGSICSTSVQTGHGSPVWQSVYDLPKPHKSFLHDLASRPQVICDGGIRCGGDAAKAVGAGADFLMCGSLFAGTDEAPGEVFERDGKKFKRYLGMASRAAQVEWRGFYSSDEGVEAVVPYKGPVADEITGLAKFLQGALSYSGARTINEFQEKAKFRRVSHAAAIEASPHINLR